MNHDSIQAFFNDNQSQFSSETIRSYKIALKKFFTFCHKEYDEVKSTDIRSWLASMEDEGLMKRTIRQKLCAVKSFYQYCLEENKILKDPTINILSPKIDDSLPYYLDKRQVALLQELTRADLRERAIVETLYATGVRVSELLQIKLEDVKWETRQIWIRKGKGNKERFVLFTHDCAERLKVYLNSRKVSSIFLFCNQRGGSLSRDYVEKRFQQYSQTLKFKVTPHTMRHTFAAHLTEKNMPPSYLQDLLGHVNLNSTRIYSRLTEKARKKKYDQYQT